MTKILLRRKPERTTTDPVEVPLNSTSTEKEIPATTQPDLPTFIPPNLDHLFSEQMEIDDYRQQILSLSSQISFLQSVIRNKTLQESALRKDLLEKENIIKSFCDTFPC